jgi:molybdopterin/thiamine biosynthesis adenylyltransferase
VIICSLKKEPWFEKIGIFSKDKAAIKDEPLILTMTDGVLSCPSDKNNDVEIITVNYTTDFNKRNHGIIDTSVLQERKVTLIGLGSGGSAIALDLIRCGITNLNLIEFDTVSLSNLCRSEYDLFDVGRKKTEVIKEKLLRINPCVNIQLYNENVLEMKDEVLRQIIKESDLIIEGSDSVNTKVLINGLAHSSTSVLYPSVYEHGKGGDVLFTLPGLPCYECVFKSILNEVNQSKQGDWDYSTNQAKPMPALISDIQVIVARTVKIAMAILTGDTKDSFIEKVTEPGCSILFIGNERDVFVFDKPFQEVWAKTSIDSDCSCQTLK